MSVGVLTTKLYDWDIYLNSGDARGLDKTRRRVALRKAFVLS